MTCLNAPGLINWSGLSRHWEHWHAWLHHQTFKQYYWDMSIIRQWRIQSVTCDLSQAADLALFPHAHLGLQFSQSWRHRCGTSDLLLSSSGGQSHTIMSSGMMGQGLVNLVQVPTCWTGQANKINSKRSPTQNKCYKWITVWQSLYQCKTRQFIPLTCRTLGCI